MIKSRPRRGLTGVLALAVSAAGLAVVSTATSLAVLAMYVAVVTTAISFMLATPLRVWVASTALTLAATAGRLPAATALFVLTGTGIAAALYLSSMRARVLYLPESDT